MRERFRFYRETGHSGKGSEANVRKVLLRMFPKVMQTCPEREVVVEIEHIKLIRKRASTKVRFCRGCKTSVDFLLLTRAAELFDVAPVQIFDFTRSNSGHYVVGNEGEIYICLADLLQAMGKRMKTGKVKLLGECNEESTF